MREMKNFLMVVLYNTMSLALLLGIERRVGGKVHDLAADSSSAACRSEGGPALGTLARLQGRP